MATYTSWKGILLVTFIIIIRITIITIIILRYKESYSSFFDTSLIQLLISLFVCLFYMIKMRTMNPLYSSNTTCKIQF